MPYMLIGGFDANEPYGKIKDFLINKTNRKNPLILYFPLASKNKVEVIKRFEYEFRNCTVKTIDLLKKINKKTLTCDIIDSCIIFFDGGSTNFLYKYLLENDLTYIFDVSIKHNKIIAGVSAGAIVTCSSGLGDMFSFKDSDGYFCNFKMVPGLDYLDITVCPHFNLPDRDVYFDLMKKYNKAGLALSNSTAVYIDNKSVEVIKNITNRPVFIYNNSKDKLTVLSENILYSKEGIF